MLPTSSRSIPLFRAFGISVSIHWTWFLVAAYSIQARTEEYSSLTWNVLEYASLFAIVLMHEFGHALACRQTGGRADRIILWPLGGVAFVDPPPRAGAHLWSIAAGPLVNVLLAPVFFAALALSGNSSPDLQSFLSALWAMNLGLLIFNVLPVYPLDGGQILRSLLWFWLGPINSLAIAAGIGLLCSGLLCLWALSIGASWLAFMSLFLVLTAAQALKTALQLRANQ